MSREDFVKSLQKSLPGIIRRLQKGDDTAKDEFCQVVIPYLKPIVSKHSSILPIYDEVDSIVHMVVMKLLKKVDMIDPDKSILSYMSRSAINQAIDESRKYIKKKTNNSIEYKPYEYYDSYTPVFSGISNESLDEVLNALKEYTNNYDATLLSMHYLEDKSIREIAAITGQPEKDIEEAIDHAKENLSRAVE